MKIVQDEKFLRQKSEPATLEEAQEITEQLFMTLLEKNDNDVGLAASQIGILKQVAVIRAKEAITLVNPRIVETDGEIWYQEGCLSFPGASVRTKRHKGIVVECDYLGTGNEVLQQWQENVRVYFAPNERVPMEEDKDLLESIAVQHEIDHMNGILMFDREWKNVPIRVEKKQKPNEKCACGSGKKYKKCCGKI